MQTQFHKKQKKDTINLFIVIYENISFKKKFVTQRSENRTLHLINFT